MTEEIAEFDLVAIGGGPAGIVAATTAVAFGKTVAVVDNHHELGGAGANTGTVPSKTLRETALALSGMRSRNLYGVDLSLRREATVADFLRHEQNVKTGLNQVLTQRFQASHTGVYYGTAEFVDAHLIRVQLKTGGDPKTTLLRGEHILIATGSTPVHPPAFCFDHAEVYDSDTILGLDRLPKSIAVVGAGAVGSEYACTFAALGTKVHLIDGHGVLLPFLDAELSRALTSAMQRNGIVFHWNTQVETCSPTSADGITLCFQSGETLQADAVLVTAGRKSNIGELNLSVAGVASGERGVIPVDDHYQTNVPHIFAAGDVIGFPALASTSMQQARQAIRHAFGVDRHATFSGLLPTGVYTIPEVSMVGQTEENLQSAGIGYVAGKGAYASNARGCIIGDSEGFLKLLFRREDMKLLGVHAIGEQATELIHVGLIALLAGSGVEVFDEACFNIPTLGSLYKTAALDAMVRAARSVS